jgi:hypothetical protein
MAKNGPELAHEVVMNWLGPLAGHENEDRRVERAAVVHLGVLALMKFLSVQK